MEALVILLIMATSFISFRQISTEKKVDSLQNEMKSYLNGDRVRTQEALFNNTETMKNTNTLLIDLRYYFQNKRTP